MLSLLLLLACTSDSTASGPDASDTDTDFDGGEETDSDSDSVSDSDSDSGPDTSLRVTTGYHDVDVATGMPTTFHLLVSPAKRTIEHGPQGGWHVEASARVYNSGPLVQIRYEVTDAVTQELLSVQSLPVALFNYSGTPALGTAVGDNANMEGFLDDLGSLNNPDLEPTEVMHHRTVDLVISVVDAESGNTASTSLLDVTLYCDQDPYTDCEDFALPLPWL
jgi:hypothetical protein